MTQTPWPGPGKILRSRSLRRWWISVISQSVKTDLNPREHFHLCQEHMRGNRLNMEKNEQQQQQTKLLKERSQLSFFQSDVFFQVLSFWGTLRWNDHCNHTRMRYTGMVHVKNANEQEVMSPCTWSQPECIDECRNFDSSDSERGRRNRKLLVTLQKGAGLSRPTLTQSNEIYSRARQT